MALEDAFTAMLGDAQQRRRTLPDRLIVELDPVLEQMVAYMKRNHAWINQTLDAERGLAGEVQQLRADAIRLALRHGVDYGIYLETRFAGRYAILAPTIEVFLPQIGVAIGRALR